MSNLIESITEDLSKFYPQNISSLTQEDYDSEETILRERKIRSWNTFMIDIRLQFPDISYIDDRSDGGVSNILLIAIQEKKRSLQFVWCLSKLVNYYCYYINDIESDNENFRAVPDIEEILKIREDTKIAMLEGFKNKIKYKRIWNTIDSDYSVLVQTVNDTIKKYYPTFILMPEELLFYTPKKFSTPSFDLGKANIYT